MTTIEAIYENGVFRPIGPVALPENERVRLHIQVIPSEAYAWFERMRKARERLAAKYGVYPDSTLEIAEDRRRDV